MSKRVSYPSNTTIVNNVVRVLKNKNILSQHRLICSSHIIYQFTFSRILLYIKKLMHILVDTSGYIFISRIYCRRFSHLNERTLQQFCLSQSGASTVRPGDSLPGPPQISSLRAPKIASRAPTCPTWRASSYTGLGPKAYPPCPSANLLQHAIKRCTYHSN